VDPADSAYEEKEESMLRTCALVVAAAVMAALAGAAGARAATVGTLTQVSGASPFASCTVGALDGDTNFPNSEVEPSVADNPAAPGDLIGVFQQDRWDGGGAHADNGAFSLDDTASWTESWADFTACQGGTFDRASDPWVSIGPDGTAYQVSLSLAADESTTAVQASTSTDGGMTWSTPKTITADGPAHFNDKESVTADPNKSGTAYVVWDRSEFPSDSASLTALEHSFAFRGSPFFSMTTDGGQTWSAPRQIGPNQNMTTIGNQIAVEPDGTLIDVFHFGKGSGLDAPNQSFIGMIRSTDGGNRWSQPIVIADNPVAEDVDPDNGVPLRTGADVGGGIPDVAVDPRNGKLYVVWEDSRFSGGVHDDIALSTSTDEGKTWSAPVRVNRTPDGVLAFTPMVDVLPNGDVGVTYYDIRNNTPAAGLPTDYFIVTSTDGGTTWTESRLTPTSFDDTLAPISRGYFLGDYQGLANDGTSFVPFFVQTSSTSDPTDVWSTTVTP
jgi:hypothetical protein